MKSVSMNEESIGTITESKVYYPTFYIILQSNISNIYLLILTFDNMDMKQQKRKR